jgi:streptogramin lyase
MSSRHLRSILPGRDRRTERVVCLLVATAAVLGSVGPQSASAAAGAPGLGAPTGLAAGSGSEAGTSEPGSSNAPSTTQPYSACPSEESTGVECNLVIDPQPIKTAAGYRLPDGGALLPGSGVEGGLDPKDLQSAYKIPATGGSKETVAVIDAYGDTYAESDLAKYRERYGLPECKRENSKKELVYCFRKINEEGEEGNYPEERPASTWGAETALDIEMVSAICPECKILLVEASSELPAQTAASVEKAVTLTKKPATVVANSYGYPESNEERCPAKKGCIEYSAAYTHPGIPIVASAGDTDYDDQASLKKWEAANWPASSPDVIAVGGTFLSELSGSSRGWTESVWHTVNSETGEERGTGSGCSIYEPKPSWQTDKGCVRRTDNDTAAVAEDVSIYSTPYEGGWGSVGGTSASAPLIAGIEAHASEATKLLGAEALYKKPGMLFHVSEGTNGTCGAEGSETYYLCHATKEGYNGPTGMGAPDGVFESVVPGAATGLASNVTGKEAALNGVVNPNGAATEYYFEFGTTKTYGTKTTAVSVGSEERDFGETKTITGLHPNTEYHFRIVATNSKGTTEALDQTFKTPQIPPENTALPVASPETPDQAVPETTTTGTWLNEPTGYTYQWERCNATGGECVSIAGATSATYTPVEADVGHTLVVAVTAKNSAGASTARSKSTNPIKPIGQITEYALASESEPYGIAKGPEGDLWFTDTRSNKIGKITTSGTITEYSLPAKSQASEITAGPDGNLWFTDWNTSKIGKITPLGTITEYSLPAESEPLGIVAGPDGNLWFAEEHIGAGRAGKIGKITTSGTITEYTLPTETRASGITKGPDGNLWFTEWTGKEGNNSRIGKITTAGAITEYSLPEDSEPWSITAGPDGNLWFTEIYSSKVGKITTSGAVTEYSIGSGNYYPYAITAGADGNLWFTDWNYAHSKIERITTAGVVTQYSMPLYSDEMAITTGPDDNLWFTEPGTNQIGKMTP